MTIAFLSTMTDYYGGEVCFVNLAAGLSARGHDVLCVVRPGSALARRVVERGLPVVELPLVDWFEPVGVIRLRRLLLARDVDLLHTHTPRDHFVAAAATAGTPIRNVGTRHLLQTISFPDLKRPFFRNFTAMIAVSHAVRRSLSGAGLVPDERLVTVPNGIPMEVPAPRGTLRRLAGVGDEAPVVGFVGRMSPGKGLATLITAAARLVPRHPGLKVLVVGGDDRGGAHVRQLRAQVTTQGLGDVVRFLGYLPDAGRFCGDFDVQAVPSVAEPFGLVTLEALARGRPVVATATGGTPEIVRHGREGYLVPAGDAWALAARLDDLLADAPLRRAFGVRGRERVRRHFSLDLMLDRTEEVYAGALGRPARVLRCSA